jgi:nucleotide-binding universal stress UspA family protein
MTRRIIVALDEGAASYRALQSAARLAAEMSAEILAVFIEEADLLSAAALPGHSVVSYQGGDVAPLNQEALARALRVRARQLREQVERVAGSYSVAWQFEVARGRVREEILARTQSCEMIAIGASSAHRRGFGRNARAIVEQASCSVIVVHERARPSPRVVILSANSHGQEIAASLARITGARSFEEVAVENTRQAFDQLMRMAPSHVVTDRAALAKLGMSPQALVNALDLEALLVTGAGNA